MTGLEERGLRPDPKTRGQLARFIYENMDQRMRRERDWIEACAYHMTFWGVPCGPTLSMVHPPVLRGILDL